ncbi:MAG: response regulator transcription factor [Treponema sp.]|jgi:DNA-binding NarL/FixJ family response regulator|nr:response regulator transcription factor [Treponema sp.]
MVRIVIVTRLEHDRKTIMALLSSQHDFTILHAGTDGYDALISAGVLLPDIIIMDMCLDDIDGPDLALLIKRRSPSTSFIVVSPVDKDVGRALRAGISGYLLKQRKSEELTASIRCVIHGGYYISAPIIKRVFGGPFTLNKYGKPVHHSPLSTNRAKAPPPKFSRTECRIIGGIAEGRSDKEIAEELKIQPGSIRNSLAAVRRRTGLRNRTQMVLYALMFGLIKFSYVQEHLMELL